jgi:hypothetical protein
MREHRAGASPLRHRPAASYAWAPHDVPVFKTVKVHPDFHVEVCKALCSVPKNYI